VVLRPLLVELHEPRDLAVLGQEVVLAEEHPLMPVDFTVGHGRRRSPVRKASGRAGRLGRT
jgi:hypothetical protein